MSAPSSVNARQATAVNDSLAADQAAARSMEYVRTPMPAKRRTLLAFVAAFAQLTPAQAVALSGGAS